MPIPAAAVYKIAEEPSPPAPMKITELIKNVEEYFCSSNIEDSSYFLPYLSGERTPHNDPHIRGSFHSIKTYTDSTNLQYAVLESICFGILDGLNSVLKVNNNFEEIFVVGGGSKSSFWLDLLSLITNRRLSLCDQSEYSAALGVARLSMFADEDIQDQKKIINNLQVLKYFSPKEKNQAILRKRYLIWKELYFKNKA